MKLRYLISREREINASAKNGKNFLIEGDNYASLKLLEKTHKGVIDVIYIDPPYNTGNEDFVYNDNIVDNEDTFRHSKWLSFMTKRIHLAYDLLSDEGLMFASIDENEIAGFKILLDSIFGENNFICIFSWMKTATPPSLSKNIRRKFEYVLCYRKKYSELGLFGGIISGGDMPLLNDGNKEIGVTFQKDSLIFKIPDGVYLKGRYDRVQLLEDIEIKDGKALTDLKLFGPMKWTQDTINKEISSGTIFLIKSSKFAIRYERCGERIKKPSNIISNEECSVGTNEDGAKDLQKIFNKKVFNFPKPVSLIKYLINMKCFYKKNAIVLDFFAGSGTTGQAVLELNKEDGGNRHFILCTNNENNICEDITYERLKTVITGKRQDGSIYRENPYEDNLTYLKVNFAEKEDDIDSCKICEQLITLKSSVETCASFVFDKEKDFYEFLDSRIYLDACVVYLLDDILLPSGSNLKERKIEIRELPKYFYSEEELINNDTI